MTELSSWLQHGAANSWLFIPSAILLGGLHGLEPGHSKTMMAAFIVAIRGTLFQAVLLGLAATVSHTALVWIIALLGLHLGQLEALQWSTHHVGGARGVAQWLPLPGTFHTSVCIGVHVTGSPGRTSAPRRRWP